MSKSKYLWLFDPGHGGIIDGKYQTSLTNWKRSFFKDDKLMDPKLGSDYLEKNCDFKFYEGVNNRDIVNRILKLCQQNGIDAIDIVSSQDDVSLSKRVTKANDIYSKDKRAIFFSIHSDAFTSQSANGFSVYTTPGFTNSDIVATVFFKEMAQNFLITMREKTQVMATLIKKHNFMY